MVRLTNHPDIASAVYRGRKTTTQQLQAIWKDFASPGTIKIFKNIDLHQQGGFVVVVVLLFYVHGKHLRSCRDDQFT